MRNQSLFFDSRSELAFEKSSHPSSSPDFVSFNRNFSILKKFENNILYIAKITFEKTDFILEINYLSLNESKKTLSLPIIEKEKQILHRNFNLETFVFEFHLEMAFKIYKENFDFYIDVNYVHFLGFLANNYKHLASLEFFLNSAMITYFPRSIKPKKSHDFEAFLKENAANYGFFCKEIRGFKNLMFYTALDYVNMKEIELFEYDFIVAFDSIDLEQKNLYGTLDHIVLGDIENSDG